MYRRREVYRFATKSGMIAKVYRVKPQDAKHLVDLFEHLSTTSRYQRFNEMLTNPDPELVRQTAERMATIEPRVGAAWLAFSDLPGQPNTPVAGARYMRLPDRKTAEVSIAVRDDFQHQGIGAQLLLYLARHARNNGVHRLAATFDTSNKGVWRLVHNAPYTAITSIHGSTTELIIDLNQPARPGNYGTARAHAAPDAGPNLAKETAMPSDIFTKIRLNNGLDLRVRAKTAEDLPRMIELFEQGSPEKRLERVGPGLHSPADEALREATRLVQLSPSDGCVWLAFADLPGQPDSLVASGRFMRCSPDEGEMSVVVRDDMQGQGIGTKMLYFVLDQARAMGISRMSSCFASDNEAVWQILSYSPYHVTWQPRGSQVEVVIHLQARTEGSPSLN
jgi:RimJ/RimL family protein N-acetyltransferase